MYPATLLMSGFVTHDVRRFVVTRPEGFGWQPGQGVELFIDAPGWRERGRPFTPTSVADDGVLEFTIKRYADHHGVTDELHRLRPGARLLISDPFGTITYQGPGTFIAAGAGITPFVAILRTLARDDALAGNRLFFSNKTPADVIYAGELRHYLGERCVFRCTRSAGPGCEAGRIDRAFLARWAGDLGQRFYLCGPRPFTAELTALLQELGASPESVVFER